MSASNIRKTMSPVGVRLTTSERRALDELAKRLGLSNAETFRHLLRESGKPPPLVRLAPDDIVRVPGPNVEYRVVGLGTSGNLATIYLETVTGNDWIDDKMGAMTEPAEDAPVDEAAEESAAEVDTEDAADEDAA